MNVTAIGIEDFTRQLEELTEQTDFSMHSYTNPIIEVNGDTATGNWLFWVTSIRNGGMPNEVFMSEDIIYQRTEKGWRVKQVDVHFGMMLNDGKPK